MDCWDLVTLLSDLSYARAMVRPGEGQVAKLVGVQFNQELMVDVHQLLGYCSGPYVQDASGIHFDVGGDMFDHPLGCLLPGHALRWLHRRGKWRNRCLMGDLVF